MIPIVQTAAVGEMGILQPHFLGLVIHSLNKCFLAACRMDGKGYGCLRAGGQDHTV